MNQVVKSTSSIGPQPQTTPISFAERNGKDKKKTGKPKQNIWPILLKEILRSFLKATVHDTLSLACISNHKLLVVNLEF